MVSTCSPAAWCPFGAGLCGRRQPQSTQRSALGEHPRQRFLADPDWDTPAFVQRYADVFSSNYIAELFCQLAWVQDHVDSTRIELPFADLRSPSPMC